MIRSLVAWWRAWNVEQTRRESPLYDGFLDFTSCPRSATPLADSGPTGAAGSRRPAAPGPSRP